MAKSITASTGGDPIISDSQWGTAAVTQSLIARYQIDTTASDIEYKHETTETMAKTPRSDARRVDSEAPLDQQLEETMNEFDGDLRQRVEELARELSHTRRELDRLRTSRRFSPATGVALCVILIASFTARSTGAQGSGLPARVVAPFTVVDDKGQELLSVTSAGGFARLRVGAQGGSVWLGTGDSNAGFVAVQRADGSNAAALGQIGNGPSGVHVFDATGKTPVAELTFSSGSGALSLARAGGTRFLDATINQGFPRFHFGEKGGVWFGVGKSGSGFVVAQRADGTDAVAIGARGGGAPGLQVLDSTGNGTLAELSGDTSGGSLTVGAPAGAKPTLKVGPKVTAKDALVTIGPGSGAGYVVRIADSAGTELATMGEARVGGGVFVANDGSGKIRMLMSGQGELHAVDPAGVSRATVTSEGALAARNAGNVTIARLSDSGGGNGILQIANSGGNAMVEAGILPTSEGVVRAYPLGGPPATMIGMPGTFIKGWTGGQK